MMDEPQTEIAPEDSGPANGAEPRVMILGDSHSVALKAGCDALGVPAGLLSFSGNLWHQGLISYHPTFGLTLKGRVQRDRLVAARERFGKAGIIRSDLPLIVSAGFHVGRLVPPFGVRGHVTDAEGFSEDEDSLFVSRAYLRSYVMHFRGHHLLMLRRIAKKASMVVVAPPPVYGGRNHTGFINMIIELITGAGLALYDPRTDFARLGQTLPPDYLAEDGVHGNDRYGTEVIQAILSRGLARF